MVVSTQCTFLYSIDCFIHCVVRHNGLSGHWPLRGIRLQWVVFHFYTNMFLRMGRALGRRVESTWRQKNRKTGNLPENSFMTRHFTRHSKSLTLFKSMVWKRGRRTRQSGALFVSRQPPFLIAINTSGTRQTWRQNKDRDGEVFLCWTSVGHNSHGARWKNCRGGVWLCDSKKNILMSDQSNYQTKQSRRWLKLQKGKTASAKHYI